MEKYNIQVINVKPNDVLLVQVNDNLDIDELKSIFTSVQEAFPKNKILIANHHILDKLSILRPEDWLNNQTALSVQELLDKNWSVKI